MLLSNFALISNPIPFLPPNTDIFTPLKVGGKNLFLFSSGRQLFLLCLFLPFPAPLLFLDTMHYLFALKDN